MRVSDRLTHGFWTLGMAFATALLLIPGQVTGQIISAANDYGSPAASGTVDQQPEPPAAGDYMQWLAAAKQAMSQQQLDLANHYLQLAEELYRQANAPVGPNPQSVRQQLSQMFAAQADPGRSRSAGMKNMNVDPTATALQALHNARTALAHSDVEVAGQMVQLAKSYSVDYSKLGDSPAIIESMIQYQNELAALANARDPSFNPKAASFLLHQAGAFISYRDFETAEMLVEQAKKFNVEFNQQTGTPDTVMANIKAARAALSTQQAQQSTAKLQLDKLMSQAQLAFDKNDLALAKSFIEQAKSLNIPDAVFAVGELRPWQLELRIQNGMKIGGGVVPASYQKADNQDVIQADYNPDRDMTRNVTVSLSDTGSTDIDDRQAKFPEFNPIPSRGMQLFRSGIQALDAKDKDGAREYFQMAWQYREQLDETTQQSIQDKLTRLAQHTQPVAQEPEKDANPFDEDSFSPLEDEPATGSDAGGIEAAAVDEPGQTSDEANTTEADSDIKFQKETDDVTDTSNGSEKIATDPPAEANRRAKDMDETQAQTTFRQLQAEVFKQRGAAERLLTKNPREALEKMTLVRSRVTQSELELESKRPLLTIIDRDIKEFQGYIEQNLPDIINEEANAQRLEDVELRRQHRYEVEQQIQNLVEDFNKLLDQQRYAEAEMVARQASALDPDSEISSLMSEKARMAIRIDQMEHIRSSKEEGVWNSFARTEEDSAMMDERMPMIFADRDEWSRKQLLRAERLGLSQYDSEAERRIWNLLKNELVQGEYQGTLLDTVDQLSRQAGVNIIFDTSAMAAEGVQTDRSVNVPIREPISLQSALNVVLGTAGLVFVVEDEVIKVTSRDAQRKDVKTKTYYIGDLVTPIKNFGSSLNMNFMSPGATYGQNGLIGQDFGGQSPLAANQANPTSINPVVAAQQTNAAMAQQMPGIPFGNGFPGAYGGGGPQTGTPTYNSIGPQSPGGVTEADFDPLIDLIKNTIDSEGWDDTNGDGTIQAYVPNLSLIVSQTQEVQDQIQDLLQKLRELNDVQIVVEVRFIILRDDFFERIGVDFDFRLNDNSGLGAGPIPDEVNPSVIIGREPLANTFQTTGDLDIAFTQDNFTSAIPQFGGFDAGTAANFGFAILSDIEVFFLIQAAKGDTRSNILNAPTVTMFNGQSASVIDASLRPFVTSVIPVVGDFAVAQQPVVTLLPDGTSLNVNAVVSNDRKFVRMTLVPFFSQVTDVQTFTFDGSTTTRRASDSLLDDLIDQVNGRDPDANDNVDLETVEQGVTIQLPTLAATTISTVVSVPDGGTVMLGGIKRMSEGRIERGVPFLSNVPYVNRLFKNVGIGRETDNLMMMVTPRIIIQEEEEAAQVGTTGGN